MFKNIFYILTFSLFFFSCKNQNLNHIDETLMIESTMQSYRNAWMQGNSENVINKLSDDIILFMPNKEGKPILGKKAVSEFWFPKTDLSYPIISYEVKKSENKLFW